jgi:hypothetical protein
MHKNPTAPGVEKSSSTIAGADQAAHLTHWTGNRQLALSAAPRQLASRARRRVKVAELPPPNPNFSRQRGVVDAFFSAIARRAQLPTCAPRW